MANMVLIRRLCEEKNITIRELCKRINRKESSLQSIIRNGSTSTATLEAIAEVLGVSPAIFWDNPAPESELEQEVKYLRKLIMEKDQVIREKERMITHLMKENK